MKILLLNIIISMIAPTGELSGVWNTNRDNTKIEIYEKNGEYFGEIVSSDNEKAKEGTQILKNFVYQNGKWKGKLYSIKMDKLVDAELTVNYKTLSITAHIGIMRKTFEWEKL